MHSTWVTLNNVASLSYFVPELILAVTILSLFLADLVSKEPRWIRMMAALAMIGCLGALIGAYLDFRFQVHAVPIFDGMLTSDRFGGFFKILILLATLLIIPISYQNSETGRYNQGEYLALILTMAMGACIFATATNLLTLYLSLEMVSLVSYVLAGYLKENRRSSEASLKYVIYGGAASGAMIYGMSFLYGISGSLDFSEISRVLAQMSASPYSTLTIFVVSVLCFAGLGYKIASVPFHMWCPDVYEGSPTPVTAYFSLVPKIAGFAAIVRFFYGALSTPAGSAWVPIQQVEWPILLAGISAVTMTVGNLVAIHQNSLKRLFAYSSIAHAGYVLMAVVVLTVQGLSAILFYLTVYFIMNLGAFLTVIVVKEATGSDHIDRIKGLGWRGGKASLLAVAMTVFLFSLAGIPPTAGFIGKVYLFSAAIHERWYWLAVIGVLNSVLSLYYYARIVKAMFFEHESGIHDALEQNRLLHLQPMFQLMIGVLVFLTVLLGLYWSPLIESTAVAVAFGTN